MLLTGAAFGILMAALYGGGMPRTDADARGTDTGAYGPIERGIASSGNGKVETVSVKTGAN
ncbi:MAG: hypothetical protein AAFV45_12825 [Pseudomonadota bacterium]